jgi:hypothetical protein
MYHQIQFDLLKVCSSSSLPFGLSLPSIHSLSIFHGGAMGGANDSLQQNGHPEKIFIKKSTLTRNQMGELIQNRYMVKLLVFW